MHPFAGPTPTASSSSSGEEARPTRSEEDDEASPLVATRGRGHEFLLRLKQSRSSKVCLALLTFAFLLFLASTRTKLVDFAEPPTASPTLRPTRPPVAAPPPAPPVRNETRSPTRKPTNLLNGPRIIFPQPTITSCKLPVTRDYASLLRGYTTGGYDRSGERLDETLLLPLQSNPTRNLLSARDLSDRTKFVFVHVNKAGGTLIKEDVFGPAAKAHRWSGEGWGTVYGRWQLLRQVNGVVPTEPPEFDDALLCGERAPISPCGPHGTDHTKSCPPLRKNCPNFPEEKCDANLSCPTRLVWGRSAMGICALYPNEPCVSTIVLREPVGRMISQYNYVCVEGREGQKKWPESWRAQGRCPLTLLQFIDSALTSTTSLIDRVAHASDEACGLQASLANLGHPCNRYLLLERLQDGLARLGEIWGDRMAPYLTRLATSTVSRNSSPYAERTLKQIQDPVVMRVVRAKLAKDVEFYRLAQEKYEEQWKRPLESCNDL